jgi:transposase
MSLIWQPSQWTRAQLEERRLFAKPLLEAGELNATQIAELSGVSPSTVRAWRRRLRQQGSLEATRAPGPPRRLTDEQIATIMDVLQTGPDPARFPDQRWTCPRVREVIGLRFNVWYDVDHVSRLLHLWGFSPQKPDKRAMERSEEAVETWVNVRVPELEKKDRGRGNAGLRR